MKKKNSTPSQEINVPDSERDLLSKEDWEMILESLHHTRHKFENYPYPTIDYKQRKVDEVAILIAKVKELLSA